MPNTITVPILKTHFQENLGRETTLTYKQVQNLWLATNPQNYRGANASAHLQLRVNRTLSLMRHLENISHD